ncbi:MAG: hypothetical protein JST20_13495 [Bacteroidetes bacterium]|nr:hypothetical protein [Bacteroidota bacterium]
MRHIYLLILFVFCTTKSYTQTKTFEIKSLTSETISITNFIEVFEDSTQNLTIDMVSSIDFDNRFHENKLTPKPRINSQEGVVWGRFKIKNLTGRDYEWSAGSNFVFGMLYQKTDSGSFTLQNAGIGVPLSERTIRKSGTGNFSIFLKSGEEAHFYFRGKNSKMFIYPSSLDFVLKDPIPLQLTINKYRTFFTGFAGIEIMMIIYALALYFVFRDKNYLWLCLSLVSSILYFMNFFDVARFIFTSDPLFTIFVTYGLSLIYIPLMVLGQFIFLNLFLEFKKNFGKKMVILYILVGITTICSPVFILFERYPLGALLSNTLIMLSPMVVLYLIIRLTIRGNPLAKIMLLSEGIFLVLVIISQLIMMQIIPSQNYSFSARILLMLAYILQSLLWTIAIIYNLVLLRKEKEKAQTDVIYALQTNEKLIREQNATLEIKVDERTKELVEKNSIISIEKDRSDKLLLNILPAEVAEELKIKGTADAKHFDDVTVLFTDFISFTTVSESLTPQELVDELHECFKSFDEIITKYNIEKIKTIGDAYLAVCGLPVSDKKHAENVVNAALEIRDFMKKRRLNLGEKTFEVRIGVNSGSVVAGIVGVKKFAYDIWGDTVNTAARMEQNSEAGKINISETTYALVKDKFTCEYRGEIDAKNKGMLKMYFVEARK